MFREKRERAGGMYRNEQMRRHRYEFVCVSSLPGKSFDLSAPT
jgi:hypothetical protein